MLLDHLRRAPVRRAARTFFSTTACKSTETKPRRRIVFSGIQPTGTPHLGNFLGALQNWVKLQQDASADDTLLFSIVGWHSLTLPQDPKQLSIARRDLLAALLAIGLDPKRSIIFHQDENPYHTQLSWVFSCITPVGKLRRMTTWKSRLATSRNANDESEVDESMLNTGLFTYPVLQAADILLYKATHVPVGEDQKQHIELARDIGDIFNRQFRNTFPLPEYIATTTRRVLSLKDPTSKMSKSSPDMSSRILLTDTEKEIRKKIRGAVTDSTAGITYDPVNRLGAANLLTILAACTEEDVLEVAKRYETKGHGDLKNDVADAVVALLEKPRTEFERLRGEQDYLAQVALEGAEKATAYSARTMQEVRKAIGLL
ncbi:tryptophanyl-tRNA synthetase [Phanerochaete sordida]|uniref:Tryptophan--tRNA ligase, mitochondrial n=1 Tax=Phanerochaete sordida TaxID=48140 RepID=A0A9P3G4R4_9APHY|nr:tryptophanyl-tRNA synthetase [Phanerochaete sordida]